MVIFHVEGVFIYILLNLNSILLTVHYSLNIYVASQMRKKKWKMLKKNGTELVVTAWAGKIIPCDNEP